MRVYKTQFKNTFSLYIEQKIKKGTVSLKMPVVREWIIEAFNGDKKVFNYQYKLEGQIVFCKKIIY